MNSEGLDACLAVQRAQARLQLKLDDTLGTMHGLAWADFALLDFVAAAPGHCVALAALVRPLGVPLSGVVRRLAPLEKLGLLRRDGGGALERAVALCPGGLRLWREARDTAAELCARAAAGNRAHTALTADLHALANSKALDLR